MNFYMEIVVNHSLTDPIRLGNLFNVSTEYTVTEQTFKWNIAEIARIIQIIFRLILIVAGTVGNGLTIYIMRRTSLKHLSTYFYMVVLAVADSSK